MEMLLDLMDKPGNKGQAAMEILSRIGDEGIAETLRTKTRHGSAESRNRALALLQSIDASAARQEATELLSDADETIRVRARGLLEQADERVLLESFRDALPGRNPEFAQAVVELFSKTQSTEAAAIVKKAFDSASPPFKRAIIRGITPTAPEPYLEILERGCRTDEIRSLAVRKIAEMNSEKSVDILLKVMSIPECAETVREELLKLPRQSIEEKLLEGLRSGAFPHELILPVLARLGTEEALPILLSEETPKSSAVYYYASLDEMEFRRKLQKLKAPVQNFELFEIEEDAREHGWENQDESLSNLMIKRGKFLVFGRQSNELKRKIEVEQAEHDRLELKLNRHQEIDKKHLAHAYVKISLAVATVLMGIMAIVSMIMNFRDPSGFWYTIMAFFAILSGICGFAVNKMSRRSSLWQEGLLSESAVQEMEKRMEALTDNLRKNRKRLEAAGKELSGAEEERTKLLLNQLLKVYKSN